MVLEHLNPVLAHQKEEQETNECMPMVAAELRDIDWTQVQMRNQQQNTMMPGTEEVPRPSGEIENGLSQIDEYIAGLHEASVAAEQTCKNDDQKEDQKQVF